MTSEWRDRKVLVAGGLGFIGSHLAEELLRQGAFVTVIDALIPGLGGRRDNLDSQTDRLTIRIDDLRNAHESADVFLEHDTVFFLAGQTGHRESMSDPIWDLDLNCTGLLRLLDVYRKAKQQPTVVLASTRQLYGRVDRLPVDEQQPVRPTDINGIHKFAAENYLRLYAENYGIPSIVLRLTNTYGPRMNLSNGSGVMPVFLDRWLRGDTLRIYGSGLQARDFNYVSDVASAFSAAAAAASRLSSASPFAVFNLGHDRIYSLLDLVEALRAFGPLETECIPFPIDAKAIDIGDYQGDYRAFRAFTGWRPQVDLEQGLALTLQAMMAVT